MAAPGGVGEEGGAGEPGALDREERLAHAERAGADRHAHDGDREVPGHEGPVRGADDVLHRERRHAPPYGERSDRTLLATARSSPGSTSGPTIWYVSWPFPPITTVSPRSAQARAARLAAPP